MLNITDLLESLSNPMGRLRTLGNISPDFDSKGRPMFHRSERVANFAVTKDGADFTLRVPLDYTPAERDLTERAMFEGGARNNPYIAESQYKRRELMVFDSHGQAVWCDVILEARPLGQELRRFMRSHIDLTDKSPLRALLQGLELMAHSLASDGVVHGNLKADNIVVRPGGLPKAVGHAHPRQRRESDDSLALMTVALATYICAGQHSRLRAMPFDAIFNSEAIRRNLKHIRTQGEVNRDSALVEFVDAYEAMESSPREVLNTALRHLAEAPFRRMDLVETLWNPGADYALPTINHDMLREVHVPYGTDDTLQVDFGKCSALSGSSRTHVRFCDEGRWGFADMDGNRLTQATFLSADDFYEGRAMAETVTGKGLLDGEGGWVMEPQFEFLEWYGPDNAAIACFDGYWELYDRGGVRLTAGNYQWMGAGGEGTFIVRRGGKYGYIRRDGVPITDAKYDDAYMFDNGRAMVVIGGEESYIDTAGHKVG